MLREAELTRRCGDDPDAIEAIYLAYRDRVWSYALRRANDPQEAADLVSETFLGAMDSARTFDPEQGTTIAWLLGIASRRLADMRRRYAREGRALARFVARTPVPPEEREWLAERIDDERAAERLQGAVDTLPETERELLALVSRDDLSPKEAAQVLGIKPTAARMRLSRARRKLTKADAESRGGSRSAPRMRPDESQSL